MNATFKRNLYVLLVAAILLSCHHKKEQEEIDPPSVTPLPQLWACHHAAVWDSLQTRNALIGAWDWEYIRCFWNPEDGNYTEYKGLSIEFKADNTLIVKENGIVTQTSTWELVHGQNDTYALKTTPEVYQLYGRILFCDNQVEFYDSYVDGCDNYFKRKE